MYTLPQFPISRSRNHLRHCEFASLLWGWIGRQWQHKAGCLSQVAGAFSWLWCFFLFLFLQISHFYVFLNSLFFIILFFSLLFSYKFMIFIVMCNILFLFLFFLFSWTSNTLWRASQLVSWWSSHQGCPTLSTKQFLVNILSFLLRNYVSNSV